MTDRTNAATDVTYHKAGDQTHGKLLSFTDAKGNTYTTDQSKEKISVASKAMVGAGVIPALQISEHNAAEAPAPHKPESWLEALENGTSNFINAAGTDRQAAAQKIESTPLFKAVATTTENVIGNTERAVERAVEKVAAKVESSSIYKSAAKETHKLVDSAAPYGKAAVQNAELGLAVASFGAFTTKHIDATAKFGATTADVTKDLAIGAFDEVTQHPGQIAEAAIKGLGTALIATAVVAGAAALAPEAAIAATAVLGVGAVAGLGYEGYQFAKHVSGWSQDAKMISNQDNYSPESVAAAHADLQGVGADAAVIGSGVAGAMIAAPLATLEAGDAWEGTMANRADVSNSGDSTLGVLGRAVQRGDYEIQDVNGVSVLMPKQPSVIDILKNAVTSGRYEPQTSNGGTVLMPR